jgi:hypothetical protein
VGRLELKAAAKHARIRWQTAGIFAKRVDRIERVQHRDNKHKKNVPPSNLRFSERIKYSEKSLHSAIGRCGNKLCPITIHSRDAHDKVAADIEPFARNAHKNVEVFGKYGLIYCPNHAAEAYKRSLPFQSFSRSIDDCCQMTAAINKSETTCMSRQTRT